MKKILFGIGLLAAAMVACLATMVVVVRMRGGLGPEQAGLAKVPLVGGLFPLREAPEEPTGEPEEAEGLEPGRELPFVRFGTEARLRRLAEQLTEKKSEYDAALMQLNRRERELESWEGQLQEERDTVLKKFTKRRQELESLREELNQRERELDAREIKLEQAEESNLKGAAEIYGKMAPDRAAEILTEMFVSDQKETVVKIIYLMNDRNAAKVLESLETPQMGAEITERLKHVIPAETQQGG